MERRSMRNWLSDVWSYVSRPPVVGGGMWSRPVGINRFPVEQVIYDQGDEPEMVEVDLERMVREEILIAFPFFTDDVARQVAPRVAELMAE